jgi:hypothetical protein
MRSQRLASVRVEGLEPSAEDQALFAEAEPNLVALSAVSGSTGQDPYLDPASGVLRNLLGINDPGEPMGSTTCPVVV